MLVSGGLSIYFKKKILLYIFQGQLVLLLAIYLPINFNLPFQKKMRKFAKAVEPDSMRTTKQSRRHGLAVMVPDAGGGFTTIVLG